MRLQYVVRQALGRSAFELPGWEDGMQSHDMNTSQTRGENYEQGQTFPIASADYVQQYNVRGHPQNTQSKQLARRFRIAQNDVLTTIGVCVVVDQNGKIRQKKGAQPDGESERYKALIKENSFGLCLGLADAAITIVSTLFVDNLRAKIQTFSFYSMIALLQIHRTEKRVQGPITYLFAGAPALLAFNCLNVVQESFITTMGEKLEELLLQRYRPQTQQHRITNTIRGLEQVACFAAGLALLPLEFFASLQMIGLIPAWPLLPTPHSWSFGSLYGTLIPSPPASWTTTSSLSYAMAICLSPIILSLAMAIFDTICEDRVSRYCQILLPKPGLPDRYSIHGSIGGKVAGEHLRLMQQQSSISDEVKKEFQPVLDAFRAFKVVISHAVQTVITSVRKAPHLYHFSNPRAQSPTDHPAALVSPNGTLIEGTIAIEPHSASANIESMHGEHSPASTPSPRLSFSSEDGPPSLSLEHSNVQITTRTGSTDTLHMQVELNTAAQDAPIVSSSFSASPHQTVVATVTQQIYDPRYRITALSLYPTEYLGRHITVGVVTLLRLPLEALYFRSIAMAFLSVPGASPGARVAAANIAHQVYAPNVWFGPGLHGGDWSGVGDYATKMLLCVGIEAVVGLSVWWTGSNVALLAGRRWYGWGEL